MRATDSMLPAGCGSRLTVNLNALVDNWRVCARKARGAQTAAVVKANAYGLGYDAVIPSLVDAGCQCFFVALAEEGRRIRDMAPDAVIYVMNGLFPALAETLVHHDLRPCLGSLEEVREWAAFSREQNLYPAAALHIDSGMNRLGLNADEVALLARDHDLLDSLNITLVMSHLACASTPTHPMNEAQRDRFNQLRAMLPAMPASLANTGGILLDSSYHLDIVRPGIGLYGVNPRPGMPSPFKPVVTLEAQIIRIREIPPGAAVGYNAAYTAPSKRRIAIISAGYADGCPRALGEGRPAPCVHAAGIAVPIAGQISMDMLALDITDTPPDSLRRGDFVELFGSRTPLEQLAFNAQTIGYEILTRIGKRCHRRYIGQRSPGKRRPASRGDPKPDAREPGGESSSGTLRTRNSNRVQ